LSKSGKQCEEWHHEARHRPPDSRRQGPRVNAPVPEAPPRGEIGLARDPRAWALLFAGVLTIMSNAIIAPALPGIEAMFRDTPHADLLTRLLVTVPSLMIAVAAPFAGFAADRFGRRRQLLAGTL